MSAFDNAMQLADSKIYDVYGTAGTIDGISIRIDYTTQTVLFDGVAQATREVAKVLIKDCADKNIVIEPGSVVVIPSKNINVKLLTDPERDSDEYVMEL